MKLDAEEEGWGCQVKALAIIVALVGAIFLLGPVIGAATLWWGCRDTVC